MADHNVAVRRLAACCVLSAIVAGGLVAAVASPVAGAPPGAPRVTLMGDSTLMAMEYYPNDDEMIATTYDVYLETGNCRRLVRPSCPVGGVATPSALPVMQTIAKGKLGQVLVMMTGYDDFHDITGDIDAIMTEATAQGVGEVLWLTYRESPTYFLPDGQQGSPIYVRHNDLLRQATARWSNLSILDWNAYSLNHPEWFSSDGIHVRPAGSVQLAAFIKAALDARPLTRCDARNALTGEPDAVAPGATSTTAASGFEGIQPVRVLDTRRVDLGGSTGMLGAGRTVRVPTDGVVPAGSTAAVLSVAAVDPCATGYLTVFPCGPLPNTSSVNYANRRNTAGLAVTMLGDDGVCVYSSAATDLIVDVLGGFTSSGARFHPVGPLRWVDTRSAADVQVPSLVGALNTGQSVTVPIAGRGGVPAGAEAVMLNATIAGSRGDTAISLQPGPCGSTPVTTSSLNVGDGRDAAASAIVALGSDGSLCATAFSGGGHVILDVAGWFGGSGGFAFRATTPERLVDTRSAGGQPIAGGASLPVEIDAASMLSVALLDTGAPGWLAVKPCGAGATSSLINTVPGEPMANATAVAPGSSGSACASPSVAAHVVVDRTGWFG